MTTGDIRIRMVQPEDAPALARLLHAIGWFSQLQQQTEEQTTTQVEGHVRQCLADTSHTLLVAESGDEEIVGYVSVHWLPYLFKSGPEGFISELFIHESARGNGIGSRLLATIVQEATERGCSRLQLINFRDRESYLRGFYTKHGWEERPTGASFVYQL